MGICPDHGAYQGECKKCQPSLDIVTKPPEKGGSVPKLEAEDQLQIVTLDRNLMKKVQETRSAQDQLHMFINLMFTKYKVDGKVYTFDADKVEFLPK